MNTINVFLGYDYPCILYLNHDVPEDSICTSSFVHFGLKIGVAPGSFLRSSLSMLSPIYNIIYIISIYKSVLWMTIVHYEVRAWLSYLL